MKRPENDAREWPRWLEPLRPDDVTRARLRRSVQRRAVPLLRARRSETGWQDIAARWAGLLAPAAALLLFGFASVAYRAGTGGAEPSPSSPVSTVELLLSEEAEAPPTLLTASTEPSADHVLAAAVGPPRERRSP